MLDLRWQTVTRQWLGIDIIDSATTCAATAGKGATATICGDAIGSLLEHLTVCRLDSGKVRSHNHIKHTMADCLRKAGACVDAGRCIPQ